MNLQPNYRFKPTQAAPDPAFGQSEILEEAERRRQAVADVDTYALGVENNHLYPQYVDMQRLNAQPVEDAWVPHQGWTDEWVKAGIPTEWANDVVPGLRSKEQFDTALQIYGERAKRLEMISDAGGRGFWGNLASYMSDPAAFTVDAGLGILGGLGAARKLNKLRQGMAVGREVSPGVIRSLERTRVAQGAAAAGVGNAAAGYLTSIADPEYGGEEMVTDLIFGAAIGAGLESIGVLFDRRTANRMMSDVNRTRARPNDPDPDLGDIEALFPGAGRKPQPEAAPVVAPDAGPAVRRAEPDDDSFQVLENLDRRIVEMERIAGQRLDKQGVAALEAEAKELRGVLKASEKRDGVLVQADPRGGARLTPEERIAATERLSAIRTELESSYHAETIGRQLKQLQTKLGNIDTDVDLMSFARSTLDMPGPTPRVAEAPPVVAQSVDEVSIGGGADVGSVAAAVERPTVTGTFGADTASAARRGDQIDASTNALGEAAGRAYAAASETLTGLLNRASNTKAGQKLSAALGTNRPTGDDLYVTEKNTIGGIERERLLEREAANESVTGRYLAGRQALFGGDISTIGQSAQDPTVRQIFRDLVSDSVQALERGPDGVLRPTVNRVAAEDIQTIEYQKVYGAYRRAYEAELKKLFERNPQALAAWEKAIQMGRRVYSTSARVEIGERVGKVLRGNTDADPIINELAVYGRKLFDDALGVMRKAGVQGADIQGLKDFLPRVHKRNLRDYLAERLGNTAEAADDLVEQLVTKAIHGGIVRAGRTPDPFVTQAVARAYTARLLKRGDVDIGGLKTGVADLDEIGQLLEEASIPADVRQKVLDHFGAKSPDSSGTTVATDRLKHRVPMDETVSIQTPDGTTLHITDLFENDVEVLAQRYAWESAGLTALARQGYPNAVALQSIVDDLKAQHRMTDREHEAVGMAISHILGKPLENDPGGVASKAGRTLGGINFVTQMGSAWMSMGPEAAGIVAATGFRAVRKQIPAFGQILRQVKTGELGDQLSRELAVLGNPGSSLINSTVSTRADDYGMRGLEGRGAFRGLDNGLAAAQRFTSVFGGLGSVQDFGQVLHSRAFAQKLFDMSRSDKRFSASEMERFMDYGMSASDVDALLAHVKAHGRGDPHGTLQSVGLDQMDQALQSKVEVLFHRSTRHVVMEDSIGQSLPFMNKQLGKLAFQFRRHQLLTWNRRMLHGLARKDQIAATTFIYSMMVAGVATYARAYVNSPEGSKQREAVNDPYKLFKAAFAGTGEATVIPMMVDTFTTMIGNTDPVFNNYHRSSGLGSDFLSGNASVATFDRVSRVLGIPYAALSTKQRVTEEDMRGLFALMPGATLVGVQRLTKAAAAEFPKEYEEMNRRAAEEGTSADWW